MIQESRLDPTARSGVGAEGLAQFMPATFRDVSRALHFPAGISARDAEYAIEAGAYYQGRLRHSWGSQRRTALQRHDLALSSYNAGMGHILAAQRKCGDAVLWPDIAPCLSEITGAENARQTTDYVLKIHRWWQELEIK